MVVYVPWVEHSFRVLSVIYKEVYTMIKRKLDARVYEHFNLFY